MPRQEPTAGRHSLRVWLKLAIETGRFERIPPRFDPDGSGVPVLVEDYARRLLAELTDPDSSDRLLREILADARRFREWVEHRQKVSRRMILGQWETEGTLDWVPERRPISPVERAKHQDAHRPGPVAPRPEADPMWDDWLDG